MQATGSSFSLRFPGTYLACLCRVSVADQGPFHPYLFPCNNLFVLLSSLSYALLYFSRFLPCGSVQVCFSVLPSVQLFNLEMLVM